MTSPRPIPPPPSSLDDQMRELRDACHDLAVKVAAEWLRFVHNVIAHPLLVLWPRAGEWLHDLTAPRDDDIGGGISTPNVVNDPGQDLPELSTCACPVPVRSMGHNLAARTFPGTRPTTACPNVILVAGELCDVCEAFCRPWIPA